MNDNNNKIIRKVTGTENQLKLNIPFGIGFILGDYVRIEPINDNEFRVIKTEVIELSRLSEDERCDYEQK